MIDPVIASDGFTYERSSIQRWFQFRKSSPSTGLEIDDITVRRNFSLAEEVRKWINGEELLESPAWGSRGRTARFGESKLPVTFSSRLGSFSRQIYINISVSSLYRLAFQGMKGRYSKFDLRFNGRIIDSSGGSGLPSGLTNYSIIHINIHETAPTPSISEETAYLVDFKEISLIKVYGALGHDDATFSYWIPKVTANSFTSIIFRYWRYFAEKGFSFKAEDAAVWIDIKYVGDGSFSGSIKDHWERVSGYLKLEHATGNLGKEKICAMEVCTEEASEMMETDLAPEYSHNPLVLKVYMNKRKMNRVKERMRESKTLSRVRCSGLLD